MSLSNVDLPEPLRPMRPVRPGLKVPLMPVSAGVPFGHEKRTLRWEMSEEMGMMSFEDLEPEMGAQDSHVLGGRDAVCSVIVASAGPLKVLSTQINVAMRASLAHDACERKALIDIPGCLIVT